MSPKKKYQPKAAYAGGASRTAPRARYAQPAPYADPRRRNITLAILGVGVLFAALIVLSSLEKPRAPGGSQVAADASTTDANIGVFLERVRQNPRDLAALVGLGNAYYDTKRWAEAVPWYEKALAVAPNDVNVRTDLGTAFLYSGNPDKAKEQWLKVLEQDPNKVETHYNLGVLYSGQTPPDNEAAAKEWETVIRMAPSSEQAKSAEQKLKAMGRR